VQKVCSLILLVEDQEDLLDVMQTYLQREGYDCERTGNGLEAIDKLRSRPYDLVVLDWMLPGLDGLEICRQARLHNPRLGILMISARGQDLERVEGLKAGADDFLAKPFHPRELVARVRALLRRCQDPGGNFGALHIDFQMASVSYEGKPIALTATETTLLLVLARHPDRILPRQDLLDQVWGAEFPGSERTVDSHIRALRAKLPDKHWIESVWGVGYRFTPPPP